MKLLVTGGAGFIGSNFVKILVKKHPDYKINVLDKLTYAGNLSNIRDIYNIISFIKGDICDKTAVKKAMKECDVVINFAAETHVDRSIINAGDFVKTDVMGTYTLLEQAREYNIRKFIQISTDEVYGSTEQDSFSEEDPLFPSSPYSASKGGADLLAHSYYITHKLPVIITRSSNNYGPYQHPEKFIPTVILSLLNNKQIPLYGDGENIRDWIYVEDNCDAIMEVMEKGNIGEVYNIGAENEKRNIDICRIIIKALGKSEECIKFVNDRIGHDRRYSLVAQKIKNLGWTAKTSFEDGLEKTVKWYIENRNWWRKLI